MSKYKKVAMVLMTLILMISAMGFTAAPTQAASCAYYHWVRYGETLASIGRYYGVSWPYLASVNGIGRPYTIYSGQRLCIPYWRLLRRYLRRGLWRIPDQYRRIHFWGWPAAHLELCDYGCHQEHHSEHSHPQFPQQCRIQGEDWK